MVRVVRPCIASWTADVREISDLGQVTLACVSCASRRSAVARMWHCTTRVRTRLEFVQPAAVTIAVCAIR